MFKPLLVHLKNPYALYGYHSDFGVLCLGYINSYELDEAVLEARKLISLSLYHCFEYMLFDLVLNKGVCTFYGNSF